MAADRHAFNPFQRSSAGALWRNPMQQGAEMQTKRCGSATGSDPRVNTIWPEMSIGHG